MIGRGVGVRAGSHVPETTPNQSKFRRNDMIIAQGKRGTSAALGSRRPKKQIPSSRRTGKGKKGARGSVKFVSRTPWHKQRKTNYDLTRN